MSIAFKRVKVNDVFWYELISALSYPDTGIKGYSFKNKVIHLEENGQLVLSEGFRWNGRSGPGIDTANTLRSSAIHDALYELIILAVLPQKVRILADILMGVIDAEDGVNMFRRWYSYIILRLFGGSYAKKAYITIVGAEG